MIPFDEARFTTQVEEALKHIRTVLDNNKYPKLPADVFHKYEDKYRLAEMLGNVAGAAQMNALEGLGISREHLSTLREWAKTKAVILRFKSEETCELVKKEDRKVESPSVVTERSGPLGPSTTVDKVVTTVTDYFWKFTLNYELNVFQGNDPAQKITLGAAIQSCTLVTQRDRTPYPKTSIPPPIECHLTWILNNIAEVNHNYVVNFSIDRSNSQCCNTPRRNPQVDAALYFFREFSEFASKVVGYYTHLYGIIPQGHGLPLDKIWSEGKRIFVPVVPLFEEYKRDNLALEDSQKEKVKGSKALASIPSPDLKDSVLLSTGDMNLFLSEQVRTFEEVFEGFKKLFPSGNLITADEARIIAVLIHSSAVAQYFGDAVNYIEEMLCNQLISAIGKVVTPKDFSEYMIFHNRKLFGKEFQPKPFCNAVRRPDHYPEGTIGIDVKTDSSSIANPIQTIVKRSCAATPMKIAINTATNVSFTGDRYLHAYVFNRFTKSASPPILKLVARARQFSCFILAVGRIVSKDVFDPTCAIIVQNKDHLKIPLMLEAIPTPKEFKDAISSLSPEQQRFAKAYRSMQLSSTLFGVCVLQIKPQVEKLLNLPDDSLTKEIKLTQDLLKLFIEYNIPSDLLSFKNDDNRDVLTTSDKIQQVRHHVEAINSVIREEKAEIAKQKQLASYNSLDIYELNNNNIVLGDDYYDDEECEEDDVDFMFYSSEAAPTSFMPTPPSVTTPVTPTPTPTTAPTQPTQTSTELEYMEVEKVEEDIDYTLLPKQLDNKYKDLDKDAALRPTIINIGETWTRKSCAGLLAKPVKEALDQDKQETSKKQAYDLLDALSRSGSLNFDSAELHIVIAATHYFDKTLMDTIIQNNINPIEKVERSVLILASTVHNKPTEALLKEEEKNRVKTYSPVLFPSLPSSH